MLHSGTGTFPDIVRDLGAALLRAPETRVPEWQSLNVEGRPQGITHEVCNVVFTVAMPGGIEGLQEAIKPNLPWAENHFQERVSGIPYNPPPSAAEWPFAQKRHEEHTKGGRFSHTYPERFWPKGGNTVGIHCISPKPRGIRFEYGDLGDVVEQLRNSPYTRQAYLPVWFPEDTGAIHKERVPCSLGYHFMIRDHKFHLTYFIRSVDFLRHFPDDVYMAVRLAQWIKDQLWACDHPDTPLDGLEMGDFTMHICNLHVFGTDMPRMEREYGKD